MRLAPGSRNFRVTELPAYAPCGSGEHLYVEVEKEGLTTDSVARALARTCGVPVRDVGWMDNDHRDPAKADYFPAWPTDWYYADLDSPCGACVVTGRADRSFDSHRAEG